MIPFVLLALETIALVGVTLLGWTNLVRRGWVQNPLSPSRPFVRRSDRPRAFRALVGLWVVLWILGVLAHGAFVVGFMAMASVQPGWLPPHPLVWIFPIAGAALVALTALYMHQLPRLLDSWGCRISWNLAFRMGLYRVTSSAMGPTIPPEGRVWRERLPPDERWRIWRGDVVVVHPLAEPRLEHVTRVVAIEGDFVEIADGRLIINDRVVEAEYGRHPSMRVASDEGQARESSELARFEPMRVPPGHVFLLGDDWGRSMEGPTWGVVPLGRLTGRLFLPTDTSSPPSQDSRKSEGPHP